MILPTKHIKLSNCLLGVGSVLLGCLNGEETVSSLWGKARSFPEIKTFERFTLGLDFLYALGVIDFKNGLLRKVKQ